MTIYSIMFLAMVLVILCVAVLIGGLVYIFTSNLIWSGVAVVAALVFGVWWANTR